MSDTIRRAYGLGPAIPAQMGQNAAAGDDDASGIADALAMAGRIIASLDAGPAGGVEDASADAILAADLLLARVAAYTGDMRARLDTYLAGV